MTFRQLRSIPVHPLADENGPRPHLLEEIARV